MGKSALSFNWLKITFSHGDWQAHFQCHSLDTFFFFFFFLQWIKIEEPSLSLATTLQVNSDTFGQGYKTLHTTLPSLNEVQFAEQKDTWREAVKPSQVFIKGCWKKLGQETSHFLGLAQGEQEMMAKDPNEPRAG